MKTILSFNLLLLFTSCSDFDKKAELGNVDTLKAVKNNEQSDWISKKKELINLSVEKGDTVAFEQLVREYYFDDPYGEFLNSAIIMANHYNYRGGYFFTYLALCQPHPLAPEMNEKTECLAYYYLLKAYELKDERAVGTVKEKFGDKEIPSANSYLVKMSELK